MSYTITDYSNKQIGNGLTVDDYSVNTETMLDLVGKGNIDYSNSIFENFIYLLSNFANPYPPGTNFAENYQNNNSWVPTISSNASNILETIKTILPGTFWFQTPELNICSNSISNLIKGYIQSNDSDVALILNNTYDPNNYFTNNQNSVYGQEISSNGTLWIYVGNNTNKSVSPNITSINNNLYGSYDPSDLGWEAYSSIIVSTTQPSNRYSIWLNMNDNSFYFYDNSKSQWSRVGTPTLIEPTQENTGIKVSDGTLWVRDGQLWMKNNNLEDSGQSYPPKFQNEVDSNVISNGWTLIGPKSPTPDKQVSGITNGFNGSESRYAVLIDDANNHHDNVLMFDGGLLIAIISKDSFTVNSSTPILGNDVLNPDIKGFKVLPGINLVSSSYYFNGSITDGGIDYATKQYVDEVVAGGNLGYTPVQQGGGINQISTHIYLGQSSDGNSILLQAGSQQYGAVAFQNWTNSNFLSLDNGGVVTGATSFNGGATSLTTSINDNSTNIATTAYVNNLLKNSFINKGGDIATGIINFNGGATSKTPNTGDNSTNIATTAFIQNTLGSYVPTNPSNGQIKCTGLVYSTVDNSPYFISPTWSGKLLTVDSNLSYLPTSQNSKKVSMINSTIDTTYNLPSFEDSNGIWHITPDINYLLNNFDTFIKKTGDSADGIINFNGGATSKTPSIGDNSNKVATTAFIQNIANNKISTIPNNTNDKAITNFIRSNNWKGNGSAGFGLWDSDGVNYFIADIPYVQNNFISTNGGTCNGNIEFIGSSSDPTYEDINKTYETIYTLTTRDSNFYTREWCEEYVGVETRHIIQAHGANNNYYFRFTETGRIDADTFNGVAVKAKYGDLAENYKSDLNYEPGTLIQIGGSEEITLLQNKNNYFGVISTNPGLILNTELDGLPVALSGRLPVKVIGKIKKGDKLTPYKNGLAKKAKWYDRVIIGFALESSNNKDIKNIECYVKAMK